MALKMSRMSEEDRKKQELINQRKAEYQAKMLAEKKHKQELERLSQLDRKAKGQEKATKASVANKLSFGANLVKFEAPQGGG